MKDELYYFHQTPKELAIKLIPFVPLEDGDTVLEPFKGEGAFYNAFPENIIKDYCEIEEGKDFKDYKLIPDWVISNPPFKMENKSAFFFILNYYSTRVNKGIAFLINDYCFSSLTPKRLKDLNEKGLYLHKIVVSSIKKWRGRYFFIIFKKEKNELMSYIEGSY